jgi:membrane protein involved in colicin uptake
MTTGQQVEIVKIEREMSAEQFLSYAYDEIEKATAEAAVAKSEEFATARLAALAVTVSEIAKAAPNFEDTSTPMRMPVTEARATDAPGSDLRRAAGGSAMFPTPPAKSNQGPGTGAPSTFAKRIADLAVAIGEIEKAGAKAKADEDAGKVDDEEKKKPPFLRGKADDDADKTDEEKKAAAEATAKAEADAKAKAEEEAKAKADEEAKRAATAKSADEWPDNLNDAGGDTEWGTDPGFTG